MSYLEPDRYTFREYVSGEVIKSSYNGYLLGSNGTIRCFVIITEFTIVFICYEYSMKDTIEVAGVYTYLLSNIQGYKYSALDLGFTGKNIYSVEVKIGNEDFKLEMERDIGVGFVDELCRISKTQNSGVPLGDQLSSMFGLFRQGIINEDEYTKAKQLFLGKPEDKKERMLSDLRRLYGLYKSGAITQSEFNFKKWDILSRV